MPGQVHTRRWNDPAVPDDGTRILITRFRPRGVRSEDETWSEWWKDLGPSVELHAAAYGKGQQAIGFEEYRQRYLQEMQHPKAKFWIDALRSRVAGGETITLLCSSACTDEQKCHRLLLKSLIEEAGGKKKSFKGR